MVFKKSKLKFISSVVFFIILLGLLPQISLAGGKAAISPVTYSSLTRTWDDLALLYDNHFHNSSEVYEEIEYIHDSVPELVDLEVIGQTFLGKDIISLRITNEQRTYQKAKALVVAQHHGREQISIEIALRFIHYLLNNYQENSTITEFIDYQEIYVIPALNYDSLDLVINEGNHWLRKNLRPWDDDGDGFFEEDRAEDTSGDGIVSAFDVYANTNPLNPVFLYTYYEGIDNDLDGLVNEDDIGYTDLNRNYDSYWRQGEGWSPDTMSQVYPGHAPFSELETQAFRDFALNHSFGMAYSLHSGINATFFPDKVDGWTEPALYWNIVQDYTKILPPSYTEVYTGYGQENYPVAESQILAGGWDTWMYFEQDCLVPITFELYNNLSSVVPAAYTPIEDNSTHLILEFKSIYDYFNPYPQYINDIWNDVRPGFDYLLDNTPRLDIFAEVLRGRSTAGSEVELSFELTNLSPRIRTMDEIDVHQDDFWVADAFELDGNSESLLTVEVTLEQDLVNTTCMIKLGNNYTGYYHYILEEASGVSGLTIGPVLAGVFLLSTALIINRRKR
ncbi:MAG: Carboxypeptidase T precursor [Candidatus Heimdallarchaeota archaeon AB_125]|nr:MAG: Carboxypeptidase T precursor [Candidatus Heimdallarchaeota archaeon AB_125]